ncbi:MAG: hemolysin III family protein [Chloroflexi bacterium]|nr:MAG: hemolysin III family protein [Chloroflexota bacterium]
MIPQQEATNSIPVQEVVLKPFLRGWFHAAAGMGAIFFTIALCWRSRADLPRLVSLLIYGLSMLELYAASALYHIGSWSMPMRRKLRALDHANIFILIAGTYTPLCFNLLNGWLRPAILVVIWLLAGIGIGLAMMAHHTPRQVSATLYVCMGWVVILALPAFLAVVPWTAVALLLLGGVLYTIGAIIYARKWPDPFPRVLGFHEIFHLFVIAGSVTFALVVWYWVVPFPRA